MWEGSEITLQSGTQYEINVKPLKNENLSVFRCHREYLDKAIVLIILYYIIIMLYIIIIIISAILC